MTGRLIHYSREPLTEVRSVAQRDTHHPAGIGKPRGLWVSVEGEDDWRAWCTSENFGIENLKWETEVFLADDARILRLSSAAEIDDFTRRYVRAHPDHPELRALQVPDWQEIEKSYQGIIIAPYCWQRRLSDHTFWYYGWDCASGCIWDATAIVRLERLQPLLPPPAKEEAA